MSDEIYEKLADALDRLPNGFPRTPSNVEIPLLKKIFAPDEAIIAGTLTGEMEPVTVIAGRVGLPEKEALSKLFSMAKRWQVFFDKKEGAAYFRLAPFIVGVYEGHLERMDHEFAHLFEEYMDDGGAVGIMKPLPALHRVVPARGTVRSEFILPYDDVKAMLEAGRTFGVRDCICRKQQDLVEKRQCTFPLKNCLYFSTVDRPPRPDDISKEQAMNILDETEKIGLVHTVSNIIEGVFYICNCCGCCCGILSCVTKYGIEESVARANYFAVINEETCTGCGVCIERCQVNAITEQDGIAVVDTKRCIGCGLCVTGCPDTAVELKRRADAEIIHPPDNFEIWEQQRLKNRDISSHTHT